MGHSCLQVFTDVQADPVAVGVSDETKANVRSAAVKITEQIHRFRAAFRTQQSVQLLSADNLIRGHVRDRGTETGADLFYFRMEESQVFRLTEEDEGGRKRERGRKEKRKMRRERWVLKKSETGKKKW